MKVQEAAEAAIPLMEELLEYQKDLPLQRLGEKDQLADLLINAASCIGALRSLYSSDKTPSKRNKVGAGYEILLMGSDNPLVEEMMQCVNDHHLRGQYYDYADTVTDLFIRAGYQILKLERELAGVRERLMAEYKTSKLSAAGEHGYD